MMCVGRVYFPRLIATLRLFHGSCRKPIVFVLLAARPAPRVVNTFHGNLILKPKRSFEAKNNFFIYRPLYFKTGLPRVVNWQDGRLLGTSTSRNKNRGLSQERLIQELIQFEKRFIDDRKKSIAQNGTFMLTRLALQTKLYIKDTLSRARVHQRKRIAQNIHPFPPKLVCVKLGASNLRNLDVKSNCNCRARSCVGAVVQQKGVNLIAVDIFDDIINPTAVRKSSKNIESALKQELQFRKRMYILAEDIENFRSKPVSLRIKCIEHEI
ncbi:hypothetical protein BDN70DRAFT_893926 [Pholiota conissans]|uniref:Uncharacterized protein n=1 Tax=Pholiota conissans TaxID=109636 RepID=A0A9P5Z449_9AGAR|nr:hypothetical protein BDN70DRAFT_893926 [Pholiota conissans]